MLKFLNKITTVGLRAAEGFQELKIGINAAHLNEQPTGIGVFTREVSRAMFNLHPEMVVFTSQTALDIPVRNLFSVPDSIKGSTRLINNLLRAAYLNSLLPLYGKKQKIDILYCPILEFPLVPAVPLVVTVHDLQPVAYPAQFGLSAYYFRLSLRLLGRIATRVTVVSEFVRKELLAATALPPDMVDVIYNGYDKKLFRPQDPGMRKEFLEKYSIQDDYILYVGNLFGYKNVRTLINAFLAIKDRLRHCLVIVGRRDCADSTLPHDDRILFMDYVPAGDLPKFYSYADLLVHPSLSEGFGFTPLEAMACGTPVLSSNRASLPEVVGDAGLLFDPLDEETLGTLILEVAGNSNLKKELIEKGFRQAGKFSWEETAAGLVSCCGRALTG